MGRGFRFKIVVVLFAIAAMQAFVAATSFGILDVARAPILEASFKLATALIPWAQLAFGGLAAWKMARAGADA